MAEKTLFLGESELLIEFEDNRYGEKYVQKLYPLNWEYVSIEPIRKNRFVVEFSDLSIDSYKVQSISNPTIVNGIWYPITLTLIELIEEEPVSVTLMKAIRKSKKKSKSQKNSYSICTIKMLDPVGIIVTTFEIWYHRFDVYFPDWSYDYEATESVAYSRLVIHPIHIRIVR